LIEASIDTFGSSCGRLYSTCERSKSTRKEKSRTVRLSSGNKKSHDVQVLITLSISGNFSRAAIHPYSYSVLRLDDKNGTVGVPDAVIADAPEQSPAKQESSVRRSSTTLNEDILRLKQISVVIIDSGAS
jgi:hypothetical protein